MVELPTLDGNFTRLALMLGEIEAQRAKVNSKVRNMAYAASRVKAATIVSPGYERTAIPDIGLTAIREVIAEAVARAQKLGWIEVELECRKLAALVASYRRVMCDIAAKAAVDLCDFENVPQMMDWLHHAD